MCLNSPFRSIRKNDGVHKGLSHKPVWTIACVAIVLTEKLDILILNTTQVLSLSLVFISSTVF